jgi:hypothetical protein
LVISQDHFLQIERVHAAIGQEVGARRCLIEKISRVRSNEQGSRGDLAMIKILPILSSIIGVKAARAVNRNRMAILLGTLVLLVLAGPISEMISQGRLVIACLTTGFLLSALQQVDAFPRFRPIVRMMVLLWLILYLLPLGPGSVWTGAGAPATLLVLSFCVLSIAARHLALAGEVDRELLCGAVGAYFLMGIFWANTYQIINFVDPEAFHGPDGGVLKPGALYYFSFTTLTTTGYGDITAVDPLARMWAVFEAIVGSMYNAIVIARLVSLYGRPDGGEQH